MTFPRVGGESGSECGIPSGGRGIRTYVGVAFPWVGGDQEVGVAYITHKP